MLVSAVQRYVVLGLLFIGIVLTAVLVLERIEGYKISTSEYYGMNNQGLLLYVLLMIVTFGHYIFAIYVIIVSPVSWLIGKYMPFFSVKMIIYSGGFAWGGLWIFDLMYGPYFVNEYHLNRMSALWIFAIAGLIYAIVERKVKFTSIRGENRKNKFVENHRITW